MPLTGVGGYVAHTERCQFLDRRANERKRIGRRSTALEK
jgi:hypothetical protein